MEYDHEPGAEPAHVTALASATYKQLVGQSRSALEGLLVGGETPSLSGIVGYEYRGYNIAPTTALLGIRKFIKAFFTTPDGEVYGCNTPVAQNGLNGPWIARPSEAAPRRYAFFSVTPVDPEARDNAYLHALLIDYGRGGNPLYDPSRYLRDYLVRRMPGSDDLLLGKAYMAIGPARIPASFLCLSAIARCPGPFSCLAPQETALSSRNPERGGLTWRSYLPGLSTLPLA